MAGVVVVVGLVAIVRKRHAHLRAVMMLLFTEVSELIFSLLMELADLATNSMSCRLLLRGDVVVPNETYKVAYVMILSFGAASTALSLAYRFRNARQIRVHMHAALATKGQAVGVSEARQQAQRFEWELLQTHRTLVVLGLALMNVGVQGEVPRCPAWIADALC
jgi:hypothetical protein